MESKKENEKNILRNPWVYIVGVLIIIGFIVFGNSDGDSINKVSGEYDDFAQCLNDAGLKMYGTEWCSHCKAQKKRFGESFEYVDYIDCDYEKDICNSEGIQGYPTWKFEGQSYPGEKELDWLADLTGCELK